MSAIQLEQAVAECSSQSSAGNATTGMDYLNYLLQKWMPLQQRVAVDSSPSLHGIWDTINTTLATPPGSITRLPPEFYDRKAHKTIESIVVEEEYAGYKESEEYRTVGIGALLGEVVQRMQYWIQRECPQIRTSLEIIAIVEAQILTHGEERKGPNFALAGCHDSTLAATLASMGAMKGENNKWPQYTSSLAVELFSSDVIDSARIEENEGKGKGASPNTALRQITLNFPAPSSATIKNQDPEQDSPDQSTFYVRIRYNDRPITIPGCKVQGNHLPEEPSFCTFVRLQSSLPEHLPSVL